uniref:Secreted protein n=1 Tax=Steinernema glaseri TaxID=37863 RepID=A0A1I7YW49_9BILA
MTSHTWIHIAFFFPSLLTASCLHSFACLAANRCLRWNSFPTCCFSDRLPFGSVTSKRSLGCLSASLCSDKLLEKNVKFRDGGLISAQPVPLTTPSGRSHLLRVQRVEIDRYDKVWVRPSTPTSLLILFSV